MYCEFSNHEWNHLSGPTPALSRSTEYWSDAAQTRLVLVDDLLRQVPPSALTDTAAFDLVDGEMAAIRRALRTIGTRRNALTPTCRIPPEILAEIFLFYQQTSTSLLDCIADAAAAAAAASSTSTSTGGAGGAPHTTLKNTPLRWVPGVAHVCRHWRAVALEHPRLWANVTLRHGRDWAQRMLALSKSAPIRIALADPDPCEASMPLDSWGLPASLWAAASSSSAPGAGAARRRAQLEPVDVLAQHLFHMQELELAACACSIRPWVRALETAAPLLEVLCLRVVPHRPGTRHDVPVPLPRNFLATHPRLHRLTVDGALLSSWAVGPGAPLAVLTRLNVFAPDPRKATERAELVLPPLDEFLDALSHMPALEAIALYHCLPPFDPSYSTHAVPLPHLRTLNFHDRVDRCRQVLDALDVPPTTTIKVSCWSACPPSEHDCLRILPSLSAHLCRPKSTASTNSNSSSGGPYALSLSSASIDGHTEFALAAWRSFSPPTLAEDREQYFGPRGTADVRLECEWDASEDPEMERRALRRACAGVPLDELRALSVCAEAAVWDAHDWYDTFVGSGEITHVAALEAPGGSLLDALMLPLAPGPSTETSNGSSSSNSGSGGNGGGGDDAKPPLFPELVSLTLAGVNFVRASEAAWRTMLSAMAKRQASPACVTILDRVELRASTVTERMVDVLNEFAAVVVWDSVTDPDNWMHVPREVEGEGEDGDGDGDADADADEDEDED